MRPPPARPAARFGVALALLTTTLLAAAADPEGRRVALTGQMGSKALLVIDGSPKALGLGQTHAGVTLRRLGPGDADLEVDGQLRRVVLGAAPVNLGGAGGAATGRRIVMPVGPGGHFMTSGTIDGGTVQFMVDTGATTVALSQAEAQRLGLAYRSGTPVKVGTANGASTGHLIKLRRLRIQDVEVHDVEAVVTPQAMPFVLLGNSYLERFEMTRSGERLTLERRF